MRRPRNLTAAERDLFAAVAKGESFDRRTGGKAMDDPALGAGWPASRSVRAEVVRALCVGGKGIPPPDPRGISIAGVRIDGSLDLESVTAAFPLTLSGCHFAERINCRDARIRLLDLEGSFLAAGLDGTGGIFDQVLLRRGLVCQDAVRLVGARVSGFLDCSGATLHGPGGDALHADYIAVDGPVYLRAWVENDTLQAPFIARGAVRFFGARIGGLDCRGASLRDATALNAEGASIKGSAVLSAWVTPAGKLLEPFVAVGTINLFGAEVAGSLECVGATFEAPAGIALNGEGIAVGSSVYLMPAVADGSVLRRFVAQGEVRLFRARIGHALECTGAFENPGRVAIDAEAVSVGGPVFLRSLATPAGKLHTTFKAEGTVRLFGAEIGGSLECDGATFEGADGMALQAEAASVQGVVLLRTLVTGDRYVYSFSATGEVRLAHARLGSGLDCSGGAFETGGTARVALNLSGASIDGPLYLRSWSTDGDTLLFHFAADGVNLESASAHTLHDNEGSWPADGGLELDGFTYQRLSRYSPATAAARLDWLRRQEGYERNPLRRLRAAVQRRLRRQRPPAFRNQPYEQLIGVLRAEGREQDARKVAIAKQSDLRRSGQLGIPGYLWNLTLGTLVGHGYRPGRTLWIAILVVAVGVFVFNDANQSCAMGPTGTEQQRAPTGGDCWVLPDNYPRFNPVMYSLDVFLPIVDLHQEGYWLPNGAPPTGWLARLVPLAGSLGVPARSLFWGYTWLHIALGWILTTFIVAALSGLIRKD